MEKFFKPYDCDLREYEARLASSREIWDDCSHEWSYSPFDEKNSYSRRVRLEGRQL